MHESWGMVGGQKRSNLLKLFPSIQNRQSPSEMAAPPPRPVEVVDTTSSTPLYRGAGRWSVCSEQNITRWTISDGSEKEEFGKIVLKKLENW